MNNPDASKVGKIRSEVDLFISSGNLRSALEKDAELSEEGINFLIYCLKIGMNGRQG